MNRYLSIVALVLFVSRVAGAQTAPAGQPPPPGTGSGSAAPTEPAPPTTAPPTTTEPTPPEEPPPGMKPEEPKKEEKPAVTAKYDGGTILSTADDQFELKLQFRNQVRFEANRSLDDTKPPVPASQFLDRFYIVRARFQAEGHLFGKDNRFKLELGMGDQGSFSFVKDMFMEKRLPDSPIYVRFGQWKRPFNRQEMVSDFSSTFNERSIENELAGGGRSLGVALHNDYEKSPEGIEWAFGMFNDFNGGSDRPTQTTACTQNAMTNAITCTTTRPSNFPTDFGPTLVARVGFNSPKIKGYSESDLEGGPMRYAVGASYKVDLANLAEGKQDSWAHNMSHGLEVDTMIKAMGYSLHAAFVMMKQKQADAEFGLLLQPGMFVVPKHGEIAARFGLATVTVPSAMAGMTVGRKQIEARAAFNWYWHGHTWKLATDAGFVKLTGDDPVPDDPDLQFRVMLQMQI